MSFWTGLEALSGHRPGAFTGMTMKDLFDKDMWERLPREFPSPRYAEEGLPTPTTAWYGGAGGQPTAPPAMALGRDRPFPIPRRDAGRTTPLQQQRIDTGRDITQRQGLRTQPDIYKDLRKAPNPYARPNLLNIFSPLPVMRDDQMGGGYFGRRDVSQELFGEGKYAYNPLDMPELLGPADKVTKTVTSADPTKFDTSTTTITEKLLGPPGHRMGAFKDTAADVWKNIREDDIIKYWMNQLRGN
jgi:hypothetical protein